MKNILFICDANPFNASMGNAQRTSVILKAFLNNGFYVDIAVIGNMDEKSPPSLPKHTSIVLWNMGHQWILNDAPKWQKILAVNSTTSIELKGIIQGILNRKKYDYVFCRYISNALLSGIFQMGQRVILDIDDLPEKSYFTNFPHPEKVLRRVYRNYIVRKLKRRTKSIIKKSIVTFLPNKEEAYEYGSIFLPNISTLHKNKYETGSPKHSILFVGRLSWPPNHNGLDYFISRYWGEIIQKVPDAKLFIAGSGLPEKYREKWSSYENIHYLGFVEDIYEFYSKGNIVICPIYAGAGTNIKVIEAMSMGKVCVLSSSSTRGYEKVLKHSQNVLIDQDNTSFSKHVVQLLTNDQLRDEIAKNAFETANTYFSQDYIDKIIGDCCRGKA